MDETPNLALPYLAPSQAQKHVTVNESLRKLDALVQIGVVDRDLASPPETPEEGARYIVAAGADGAWSGHDGALAAFQDGAWFIHAPQIGWIAWIEDESVALVWDGAAWTAVVADTFAQLGVNASADATNRLAVASPAVLFSHEGDDAQLKINKAGAGDTASLVLQTGFSGRAEIGLAGDDDFHIKVSADGAAWTEALLVDAASGDVALAQALRAPLLFRDAGAAPVWRHDASLLDADAADFRFNCAAAAGVNEPYSARANVVWTLGYNVAADGARVDAAEPTLALRFDTCRHLDGASGAGLDFHVQSVDTAGALHRPISFWAPRNGTSAPAAGALRFDVLSLAEYDDVERVKFDFTAATSKVTFATPVQFEFANNSIVFKQRNAANTAWLNLPFIDSSNRTQVTSPIFCAPAAVDAVNKSSATIYVGSLGANEQILNVYHGNALTGGAKGLNVLLNTSGAGEAYLQQNGAGHLQVHLLTVGAGDPKVIWHINGVQAWSAGIDNSDSDRFKIASAGDLETNTRVTIDPGSGLLSNAGPVRVAAYTVAGAPSAATSGAGAIIHVSDESGGATLAFSDGSDWRRVHDRAVIS